MFSITILFYIMTRGVVEGERVGTHTSLSPPKFWGAKMKEVLDFCTY